MLALYIAVPQWICILLATENHASQATVWYNEAKQSNPTRANSLCCSGYRPERMVWPVLG